MTDSAVTYRLASALTVVNAEATLQAGLQAIDQGQTEFDLAPLTVVDSAAVAVLIGWQRAARERGISLRLLNASANLCSLATLYGMAEFLCDDGNAVAERAESRTELAQS